MSQAIAFDTYAYVKKLRDAGVDERQAAIQAETLVTLIEDRLATKKDLAEVEATLRRDIKELDTRVEVRLKELDTRVEVRLKELEQRMVIKLGSLMVIAVGVVAALVKLL